MNSPRSYSLSIEELAFALGILGGAESAGAFLAMANSQGTGAAQPSPDHVKTLLLAASHSLIARRLLFVDLKCNTRTLEPAFEDAVRTLLQHQYSLRCNASGPQGELAATFFFAKNDADQPGLILESRAEMGVVAHLDLLDGTEAVTARLCDFFGLPGDAPNPTHEPPVPDGRISAPALEAARQQLPSNPVDAIQNLEKAGLPPSLAVQLVEDLLACDLRGSVIAASQPQPGSPIPSDPAGASISEGLLLLKGQQHFWIFNLHSSQPTSEETHGALEADIFRSELLPGNSTIFPILLHRLIPLV